MRHFSLRHTLTVMLTLLVPTIAAAQNRDFRSERLVLDDNGGNMVTISPLDPRFGSPQR